MIVQKLVVLKEIPQILFSTNSLFSSGRSIRNNANIWRNFHRGSRTRSQSRPFGKARANNSPFEGVQLDTGPVNSSALWKPFVFTMAFSTGSLLGASIYEYEILRAKAVRTFQNSSTFAWFKNKLNQRHPTQDWRKDVNSWWSKLSPGEKVFAPICVVNLIVFGLWRVPRFQPNMIKYFCSNPAARVVCWPMFLSTISHYSAFHIFANMYVLHSFSNAAVSALGREQFMGLYLSAGVVATFASYVYKVIVKQPGISLGASGAIMAILALVCAVYPETQLSILFLPTFTFSAGSAIKVIMGIDLAGCLLGWKFFDHAAHLGGALFGLFWCYFGSDHLWSKREFFLRYWHQLRTSK